MSARDRKAFAQSLEEFVEAMGVRGKGSPMLFEDPVWHGQLQAWSRDLPRPNAIHNVSAHWEKAPLSLTASGRLYSIELPK